MGRNRSPSPRRDRRRSPPRDQVERRRSPPRERRHRQRRSRSRTPPARKRSRSPQGQRRRSRSPIRRRSSSPLDDFGQSSSSGGKKTSKGSHKNDEPIEVIDLDGMEPESMDMMRMMGFSGFDSTKGKKVEGNNISSANIITKRKFRQYMNRRGGFNRPLDFIA